MLKLDISCFENRVDPDRLASEKPADQDQHYFNSACKSLLIIEILQDDWIENWGGGGGGWEESSARK